MSSESRYSYQYWGNLGRWVIIDNEDTGTTPNHLFLCRGKKWGDASDAHLFKSLASVEAALKKLNATQPNEG